MMFYCPLSKTHSTIIIIMEETHYKKIINRIDTRYNMKLISYSGTLYFSYNEKCLYYIAFSFNGLEIANIIFKILSQKLMNPEVILFFFSA